MHPLYFFFLFAATSYGLAVLYLYLKQPKMVFYPKKDLINIPSDIGLPYQESFFVTSDNVCLHGWWIGNDDHNKTEVPVILLSHGNGGNISHRLDLLRLLHNLGLQTFIFDYRGYGKSEGEPDEKGTYLDIKAAWLYLTENQKVPASRIILMGRSLGGGIAAHLAASTKINATALILESTFTSVPDVGAEMYPFLPVRSLSRFQYDTLALIPRISMPLLVIHSPEDAVIPYHHGQKLYDRATCQKEFLQISGSHDDGFLVSGEVYSKGLQHFIEKTAHS